MTTGEITEGIKGYLYSDGMADYITMIEGLGIIGKIAGMIVGLLVMLIIVGLPVVIAIEVCYINFPTFQDGYTKIYHRLKGKANRIFGLVIRDAMHAVELAETTEYGASVNWIYFKIKCKSVFFAVFIVAMVLGPGEVLIKYAYNILKGMLDWLSGLF